MVELSKAVEVVMPAMEAGQVNATLVRWLFEEGDEVTAGAALMEIETDKLTVEIEAPASGVLRELRAKDGDEVPVGKVVAMIETD